jgi:mRNA interferase MazF
MSSVKGSAGPARGEVWLVNLDPMVGHEQGGRRPTLVVSDNALNHSPAGLVIVLPITGTDRGIVAHVRIPSTEGGLTKSSLIMTDQVRTISTKRLGRRLGTLSTATMGQVDRRLRFLLGL